MVQDRWVSKTQEFSSPGALHVCMCVDVCV